MKRQGWQSHKPAVVTCATERQWVEWADQAIDVPGKRRLDSEQMALTVWCHDCTPEYQAEQQAAGRCFRGERPAAWYRGERREDALPLGYHRPGMGAWCVICCGPYTDECAGHPLGLVEAVAS